MKAAFDAAVPRPYGRGERYILTARRGVLHDVLAQLTRLVQEAEDRVAPAYELGVDLWVLRRCSTQPLLRP